MRKLKKILSSRTGDSIIEIMVSVTVLLMVAAFFVKSMNIATHAINQSDDYKGRVDSFCEEYYRGDIPQTPVGTGIKLISNSDNSEISINTRLYKASNDTMSMYSFGIYEVSRE